MLNYSMPCSGSLNLSSFWFIIKQQCTIEEISIFSKWISWMEGRAVGHNFERDPPKDLPCLVWFNLVQWFQRRFKYGSLRCTTIGWTTDANWWQKLTWPLARGDKNASTFAIQIFKLIMQADEMGGFTFNI